MEKSMARDEVQQVWKRKPDDDLVEAARHLAEYLPDGQQAILAEISRRGLDLPEHSAKTTETARGAIRGYGWLFVAWGIVTPLTQGFGGNALAQAATRILVGAGLNGGFRLAGIFAIILAIGSAAGAVFRALVFPQLGWWPQLAWSVLLLPVVVVVRRNWSGLKWTRDI